MSYTYPMWFKSKDCDLVVKFYSLRGGEVIVTDNINNVGDIRNPRNERDVGWIEHTDITFWEDVTNSFNPLNFGINTNEAPKCQHEISFDEECSGCEELLKKYTFEDKVISVLSGIQTMLIQKNKSYGNSALKPIRIFSKTDNIEQIKVRIDDKLSRISKGNEFLGDDTIDDLIGYLVLLKIAKA